VDERRTGWLLILVLVGQLVLLAVQLPGAGGSETYLETAGLRVVGPFARLVEGVAQTVHGSGEGLHLQRTLVAENRRLRSDLAKLRLEMMRLEDVRSEAERLAGALRYSTPPLGRIRVADVVYIDHTSWLTTLVLYSGAQPVQINQTALSPNGLVGRVVVVAPPYAKVQIITDRAAGVGAMIARTRRQGVVRGVGGGALELDYVPLQADVRRGDRVLTAGIDGIYPRGIPIGTVSSVKPGGQLFHDIRLAPAVDLGSLDQVYLLEHPPVPPRVKEAAPGAHP
jgi:rod shape-determining protein MreC